MDTFFDRIDLRNTGNRELRNSEEGFYERTDYRSGFDGTLCRDCYPKIGEANEGLIRRLKELRMQGDRLILWTCRSGERLEEALFFCMARGLIFDAVNENLPETIEQFGGDSRKIFADVYIDDRCLGPWEILSRRSLA